MKLFVEIVSKVNLEKHVFAILFKSQFGWSNFAPKMLQVYFSKNFKFWRSKFSFSPDPVIFNLKLQLAYKISSRKEFLIIFFEEFCRFFWLFGGKLLEKKKSKFSPIDLDTKSTVKVVKRLCRRFFRGHFFRWKLLNVLFREILFVIFGDIFYKCIWIIKLFNYFKMGVAPGHLIHFLGAPPIFF